MVLNNQMSYTFNNIITLLPLRKSTFAINYTYILTIFILATTVATLTPSENIVAGSSAMLSYPTKLLKI